MDETAIDGLPSTASANLRADQADRRARAADKRADAADDRADVADLRADQADERLVGALTFFAEAEHRIKTGLTVIGGWAQMLDDGWDDFSDDRRRQGISVMRERSDSMAADADKLLDGVRTEVVMQRADLALVKVARLLNRIANAFTGLSPATAVVAVVEGDPVACVDAEALDQVLLHLVDNAVKYSPEGGQITLRAGSSGTQTCIEVIDEGIGLPDDVDIFAPFARGQAADQLVIGSGVGLYVVARLVRSMNGTIDARRNPHGGSTFTLALPAVTSLGEPLAAD
jgi:signal transduction histidine kinase